MESSRRAQARHLRHDNAERAYTDTHPEHLSNGDDERYRGRIACYSKGLPHDRDPSSPTFGEVRADAYATLVRAVCTGDPADFEAIAITRPTSGAEPATRALTNPQAGIAFDVEGVDAAAITIPPAPRIDSDVVAGEMAELYWMALCRDIHFGDYGSDPRVADAAAELQGFGEYGHPLPVTPATVFRGLTPGDLRGPYLSQFMLHDVVFGTIRFDQRQQTKQKGTDYMVTPEEWVAVQDGEPRDYNPPADRDSAARYIRNLRDLSHYVHFDALYEAYLIACLILLDMGAPVDQGNPYNSSRNQIGFGTFGGPHILSLVTEVATRALKAVWHQKWFVHRRLRPEAYGGLVHLEKVNPGRYPMIPQSLLESQCLKEVHSIHDSYLLPMAFPEGSPTHPAYGAGHATVAGACVTVLKAWFDESWVAFHGARCKCPDPGPNARKVVEASKDGLSLVEADASECLTVGDELDKVAANVALGRNAGGVHWRTDYTESVKLGEAVALSIMRDQKSGYNERSSLRFTRFDGTSVTV